MQQESFNETSGFNLKEKIFQYLSYWYWFLLSAIVCVALAYTYLRYTVPQYSASATILVKDDKKGGMVGELASLGEMDMLGKVKSSVDNEIEIIKSKTIVESAVRDLELNIKYISEGIVKTIELYKNSPIKIIYPNIAELNNNLTYRVEAVGGSEYNLYVGKDKLLGKYKFGQQVQDGKRSFTIISTSAESDFNVIVKLQPISAVAAGYKGRLGVKLVGERTSVVQLSIIDPVKERAEDFLNRVIKTYNDDAVKDKNQIFLNTKEFIDERLRFIEKELGDVEMTAERYRKSNEITDIAAQGGLFLQNAKEIQAELLETETQLRVIQDLKAYTKANTDKLIPGNVLTASSTDANNAPSLIEQYNALMIQKGKVALSAGPKSRTMERIDSQLASLRENILASLERLRASLDIKRRDLQANQAKISGKISEIPTQDRIYKGISRQQQIKESLYLFLLQKREETAISLASTAPNAKIIDSAEALNNPVSPKRNIIFLVALFLGCLIPFAIIYIRELLDTKIHSFSDFSKIGVPYLGDVPRADDNNQIITFNSRSSTAESLRIIRTNLEFMLNQVPQGVAKTVFVTSTIPREGKTFISVNLASTIALSGKKVLLMAMDIRNPKLDEYINIPAKGLSNYLSSNDTSYQDYIIKLDGFDNMYVMPPGIIPPNPAELLLSPKVEDMFEELQTQYDYIIVDTAPVSLVTDTLIIACFAHTFLYVIRANHLDKRLLAVPEGLYREKKLPGMCMILNDTGIKKGYGYGYGYGYGHSYGYGPEYDKKKTFWDRIRRK